MRQLTPTSYAVLGLLAVRPRSAYELVTQIKRSNVRLIWPRAESKLYEEPKVLAAHGLAAEVRERSAARRATVYRITPRGLRALRSWLDEPAHPLLLEFEGLLKVIFADFGSKQQLLANLRRIRDGAVQAAALTVPLVRELAENPQFPERAHVTAIADRFLIDVLRATLDWAEWAEKVAEGWPATTLTPEMAHEARSILVENARTVESIAARQARSAAAPARPRAARSARRSADARR